jgi:hypothetical protein
MCTPRKELSTQRWILGKICYGEGEVGDLLDIKSSVTGNEYVRVYRTKNPSFPDESIADPFFTETQFEAYRALGYQIGDGLYVNDPVLDELKHLQMLNT